MIFLNILAKVSKNKYIRRSVLIFIDIVIINLAFLLSLLLTNHDLIQSFKLDIISDPKSRKLDCCKYIFFKFFKTIISNGLIL